MTNFARMWLELVKVRPEIGALWEPDEQNKWICPKCLEYYPIPRLDQLVGMVPNNFRYPHIAMLSSISTWATDYEPFETIRNMSMEELWLTYIAHEHSFELKEGKWVKR